MASLALGEEEAELVEPEVVEPVAAVVVSSVEPEELAWVQVVVVELILPLLLS